MQWVKANERMPKMEDSDRYHHVLIRRRPNPFGVVIESEDWVFSTRHFLEIDSVPFVEWLEGANKPVEVASTGQGDTDGKQ